MTGSFIHWQRSRALAQTLLRQAHDKLHGRNSVICIKSSSGCPKSTEEPVGRIGPRIMHQDVFYCKNAVNLERLLYLTRKSLYDTARDSDGSGLWKEEWNCEITTSGIRSKSNYKVLISYSANIVRSTQPDEQQPVATEKAKGINGLMTVLSRETRLCVPHTNASAAWLMHIVTKCMGIAAVRDIQLIAEASDKISGLSPRCKATLHVTIRPWLTQ